MFNIKHSTAVRCDGAMKRFRTKKKNGRGFRNLFEFEYLQAIDDVSFEVKEGEIFGIIGPNGSGKSTLIRMLSTLLLPDEGEIMIFDKDVTKNTLEVQRMINRVSVDASFFKKLSVRENLGYAARIYGVPKRKSLAEAEETLIDFGLDESKFDSSVQDLSRGQQQMVSIARSLMSKPKLLLLDEPTTGLDPQSKRKVQKFISKVSKNERTTIILTSHDMDEVEKLCERIAFIKDGKIWGEGSADDLKQRVKTNSLENVFLSLTGEKFEEVA
ncbi:MAG: ABC transporter ATP-binding protein [Candidatus Zixiibacteriota bacterium]